MNTGMCFTLTNLTTDLVELKEEMVFLCQFGWQFNLDFFIEFWLPEWKAISLSLQNISIILYSVYFRILPEMGHNMQSAKLLVGQIGLGQGEGGRGTN